MDRRCGRSDSDRNRDAAAAACTGDCKKGEDCKYKEISNTISGPEERAKPSNADETQYRYESVSEGTCQCE